MARRGPTRYSAHEHLVRPARSGSQIWRLFVGLLIIGGAVLALNSAVNAVIFALAPSYWRTDLVDAALPGATPMSMLILLASFGFVVVGIGVAVRLMQKRTLASVIGPVPLAVLQFWRVFRGLAVLGVILFVLPPWDMGVPLVDNLAFSYWLVLLPVSLLAVLIQTSAEEILFRGYIQQSLAARFSSPLVWMGVPALVFAVGHYIPAEAGENAIPIALWAGVFGCLMADLTARAGTLGPAIAVHLFNNIIALLIVSLPGALSGLSLYLVPFEMSDAQAMRGWLVVDFATMFVTWLVARLALRR